MPYSSADYFRYWMNELTDARRVGQYLRANCPIHQGDSGTFSVNLQNGSGHCFKCDRNWSMIEFASEHHGLSESAAHDYVRLITGNSSGNTAKPWNLPFAKPLSITDSDWQLGILARRIEDLGDHIHVGKNGGGKWHAYALYPYEPPKAVKIRYLDEVTGKKTLRWLALTDKGGWKSPVRLNRQIPLYRSGTLAKAEEIWLANGEKAADRLVKEWGVVATCLPNGEGNWRDEYLQSFHPGQTVYILLDNDPQGEKHGRIVGGALAKAGIDTRIVRLPGLPDKGDAWDYIEAGGTLEGCLEVARAAPPGDPDQAPEPRASGNGDGPPPAPPGPPQAGDEPDLIPFHWNDSGNAERLIAYAKGNIRYCSPPGIWLVWNGRWWQQDYDGGMVKLATGALRLLARQANDNESLFKFAMKSANRAGIANMIALAQGLAFLDYGAFDGQPQLIPCQNGTMDITTGEFRPHRKEDYVTRLFPASYSPELGLPQHFLRVLDELMGGGADASDGDLGEAMRRMDYLQKAFGYMITGEMKEKAFFVFLGETGNNGKTLIRNLLCDVMGDYAVAIDPLTLTHSRQQGDSNKKSDIARMKGARMVHTAEPPGNEHFDQGVLKELTQGSSIISASFKHKDTFHYRPTAKPLIETNRMLRIDSADPAFLSRLHLIEFRVQITEERMDRDLREKLLKSLDAIFTWIVEGALIWRKEGLLRPVEQQEIITGVIAESIEDDGLGPFLEECFDTGTHLSCAVAEIEKLYLTWAKKNGVRPLNRVWLARRIAQRPYVARVEQRGQRKGIARLKGICPKETPFAPRGKDAQYKDDHDDDEN